jgi:hypothetical protein
MRHLGAIDRVLSVEFTGGQDLHAMHMLAPTMHAGFSDAAKTIRDVHGRPGRTRCVHTTDLCFSHVCICFVRYLPLN